MTNFSSQMTDNLININSYSKNKLDTLFNNNILAPVLGLLLVIYASLAAPKLPPRIGNLFNNTWFKILFLFLISYSAWKNPIVSIMASIGILITIQLLTYVDTSISSINKIKNKNNKNNNNNNNDDIDNHQYDIIDDNMIDSDNNKVYNSNDTNIVDNTNSCTVPKFDIESNNCDVLGYSEPVYANY